MASTKELEDTLPVTAPEFEGDKDGLLKKYAVYTMVPLDVEGLKQLETDLNTGDMSNSNCRLAPNPDFANRSLREIYDYHIHIRNEDDDIHHEYFIVADQEDWTKNGVLMVYLAVWTDRPDPAHVVGVGRCAVGMADCVGANLEIANVDWTDFKEEEQDQWGGDDPYDNRRYFATDPRETPEPVPGNRYVWYSFVKKALPICDMLEPNWVYLKEGQSRLLSMNSYDPDGDLWSNIRRNFPFECLRNEEVHRKLFLVAEKEDADSEGGMSICRALWSGDLSGFSYDPEIDGGRERDREKLSEIQPEIEVLKKVRASEALQELDAIAEDLDS